MGAVFGIMGVKEPSYDILYKSSSYEIRRYGSRFGIETDYICEDDSSPFFRLAKYIGVIGKSPMNEGKTNIAMTAPVSMSSHNPNEDEQKQQQQQQEQKDDSAAGESDSVAGAGGELIAMTAPVSVQRDASKKRTMRFFLPKEYDSLHKIPKPTNPNVRIIQLPPEMGAIHRYTGSFAEEISRQKAVDMAKQLQKDGLDGEHYSITEDHAMANYQFWGFNPPFTLPFLRRNEVFLKLTEDQVNILLEKNKSASDVAAPATAESEKNATKE